jgi:hypothetical protein
MDLDTREGEGDSRGLQACQAVPPILEELATGLQHGRSKGLRTDGLAQT